MKRILVPVDFSDWSLAAVNTAIELALKAKAEVFFLHMLPATGSNYVLHNGPSDSPLDDRERKQVGIAKSHLSELLRQAEAAGVEARQELVFSKTQDWIGNNIRPFHIDLVVMGARGSGRARGSILGSTTLQFIHHSPVPVLVVKTASEKLNIKKIVFASDFQQDILKSFELVAELAATWEAHIDLLYVCTPYHHVSTRKQLASMKRFMHQFRHVAYTPHVYNATTEESGIDEFAKDNNVDMIAMSTQGRTGLLRILKPSIAEGLVKRETRPLLVVNVNSKLRKQL